MSTQVEARTEVGTCDMGNVFIFHRFSADGDTWMVRAGNHTVGTYTSEEAAETVARALCGDLVSHAFVAEHPEPPDLDFKTHYDPDEASDELKGAMEEHVKAVRKRVSKK